MARSRGRWWSGPGRRPESRTERSWGRCDCTPSRRPLLAAGPSPPWREEPVRGSQLSHPGRCRAARGQPGPCSTRPAGPPPPPPAGPGSRRGRGHLTLFTVTGSGSRPRGGLLPVSCGETPRQRGLGGAAAVSARPSPTDVLKALPCSLFFSLKTHSALPRRQPPGSAGPLRRGGWGAPPISPLRSLRLI